MQQLAQTGNGDCVSSVVTGGNDSGRTAFLGLLPSQAHSRHGARGQVGVEHAATSPIRRQDDLFSRQAAVRVRTAQLAHAVAHNAVWLYTQTAQQVDQRHLPAKHSEITIERVVIEECNKLLELDAGNYVALSKRAYDKSKILEKESL